MTSSEEDVRSTDDLESTADELDCTISPEQEEYAVTFDLPGRAATNRLLLCVNRLCLFRYRTDRNFTLLKVKNQNDVIVY